MMTTDQKIDLFFKNPVEDPDGSIQGVLYLLRREVLDCFIGKVVPACRPKRHDERCSITTWPTRRDDDCAGESGMAS
jgi:hypothetical protein